MNSSENILIKSNLILSLCARTICTVPPMLFYLLPNLVVSAILISIMTGLLFLLVVFVINLSFVFFHKSLKLTFQICFKQYSPFRLHCHGDYTKQLAIQRNILIVMQLHSNVSVISCMLGDNCEKCRGSSMRERVTKPLEQTYYRFSNALPHTRSPTFLAVVIQHARYTSYITVLLTI